MGHPDLLDLDPDLKELPSAVATEVIPGSGVRLVEMSKDERPRSDEIGGKR